MATLEIDMGNTRSKWRLRDEASILTRGVCLTADFPDADVLSLPKDTQADKKTDTEKTVERILVAAVCEPELFEQASQKLTACFAESDEPVLVERVSAQAQQAGVHNAYADPSSMGVDRWLAMLAAIQKREDSSRGVMVVSCGTALTVDFVTADGLHEGGYIVPGLSLMRDALLNRTGRIRFEPSAFQLQREPGACTTDAVQNGAVQSALSMLEQSYKDCDLRWGKVTVSDAALELWLTGGDGLLLKDGLSIPCHYVEDLVLDGLRYTGD